MIWIWGYGDMEKDPDSQQATSWMFSQVQRLMALGFSVLLPSSKCPMRRSADFGSRGGGCSAGLVLTRANVVNTNKDIVWYCHSTIFHQSTAFCLFYNFHSKEFVNTFSWVISSYSYSFAFSHLFSMFSQPKACVWW